MSCFTSIPRDIIDRVRLVPVWQQHHHRRRRLRFLRDRQCDIIILLWGSASSTQRPERAIEEIPRHRLDLSPRPSGLLVEPSGVFLSTAFSRSFASSTFLRSAERAWAVSGEQWLKVSLKL